MERRIHYLFVDLGYLRDQYRSFAQRWFGGEGGIDFAALYRHAHAPPKTFYYDFGSERGTDPYLDRIRSVPGTHVRSGDPAGAGGGGQKGVAVQLVIDLLQHATRGKMTHATLLSGDADLAPVVRALVDMGTDVTVWADPASVAPALRMAADNFLPIRWQDHHHWTDERIGATAMLPGIGNGVAHKLEGSRESHLRSGWTLLESGTIGGRRADLWGMDAPPKQYSLAIEHTEAPDTANVLTVSHSDRALLLKYADIEWGEVKLSPAGGPS
jgi:hypothetical protein